MSLPFKIKKLSLLLLFASFLSCSFLSANAPEGEGQLSSKVVLPSKNGYFVLSDQSCWKVVGFSTRWRTMSEWWNDKQIVPKNYECTPENWVPGTQIEIYSKYNNLLVNEDDAANQKDLRECTHLFFSKDTGMVLFAMPLRVEDCLVSVYSEGHQAGYYVGYSEGYSNGRYNQKSADYTKAYNDGYDDGHEAARLGIPN
jgi:hypothetical protein